MNPHRIVRVAGLAAVAMALAALGMLANTAWPGRFLLAATVAEVAGLLLYTVYRAFTHLHAHTGRLADNAGEAEKHYVEVLGRIVKIVEARGAHWSGHSERVGRLARGVCLKLGMDPKLADLMDLAGQLHDIGLLAVSEALLAQHGNFGSEAFGSVQKHSEASFEVLRPLESLAPVLPAIRHHHERMNGTGYPLGLAGEDIPVEARILAVADAYDAMTHDRPHRGALSPYQAMQELRRCTPAGFDAACVAALADVVNLPKLEEVFAEATA
ncbi:MAG: HD domain-containing protein [Planctomycetota bacterium]|nr:HD domain-containing protein [Planctomycetota bacterium]